ncbi:Syndecan-2-A [Labeo rohita]|uniref:Syndecan n=1 Tax=Labeo rohita TaxID=84645 RepID=A0ABQ8LQI6_LABRO|nr:Syndecan-2-A [Labeo rohita]
MLVAMGLIAVSAAKSTSSTDDLYLEEAGSGGYPEDDDDFTSGSGSGVGEVIEETVTVKALFIEPKAEPTQDSTKDFTPKVEMTTSRDVPKDTNKRGRIEVGTSCTVPVPATEDPRRNTVTSTTSLPRSPMDVQSENLFQRTEVLAAVIAGGVIGFLFAIFLILLLVYRMRKKDEGSYDLGERKPSGAAYQKAPTKEFYA